MVLMSISGLIFLIVLYLMAKYNFNMHKDALWHHKELLIIGDLNSHPNNFKRFNISIVDMGQHQAHNMQRTISNFESYKLSLFSKIKTPFSFYFLNLCQPNNQTIFIRSYKVLLKWGLRY